MKFVSFSAVASRRPSVDRGSILSRHRGAALAVTDTTFTLWCLNPSRGRQITNTVCIEKRRGQKQEILGGCSGQLSHC